MVDDAQSVSKLSILSQKWKKIALISVVLGIVTLLLLFLFPNYYKASAVITPAAEESKQLPSLGLLSSFEIIAGAPTKLEDLESLFKSTDLTVRVFRGHDMWASIFPDRYDKATGKIRPGWRDMLSGKNSKPKPPSDWDAIRAVQDKLRVSVNRRSGTIKLSFESVSPEASSAIVGYYIEEAKSWLQEEALERAAINKKFIENQISRTVDALTRDRLYTLYGQEVEREMLARNREQFGFRIIDNPRIPDRKSRPARARITVFVMLFSALALYAYYVRAASRSKDINSG